MSSARARFGRRIRELRTKRGWTQEVLAAKAGKHWTYIGGIERGERNPTLDVIEDLAQALGVPVSHLFKAPRRRDDASSR
ncbi:MAG: helix-turn-helix transcriptional regulator [Myxococcota bacterium]